MLVFIIFLLFLFVSEVKSVEPWIFDGMSDIPLGSKEDQCVWKDVQPPGIILPYSMCLRNADHVSNHIRKVGRWPDCDNLSNLWGRRRSVVNSNEIFIDVGANIGSCSLFMAAHGAHVIAFEPQPSNLYYFKKSLSKSYLSNTIQLYEIGLGNVPLNTTITVEHGNQGNSIIGNISIDLGKSLSGGNTNFSSYSIRIETLDSIFARHYKSHHAPIISLMKMDAQGFETHVLKGAKTLMTHKRIKIIKTELAPAFLQAQGSSGLELCQIFEDYGYVVKRENGALMRPKDCENVETMYIDIIAYLK